MKKCSLILILFFTCLISSCKKENSTNNITFGLSAEYPPFEYNEKGQLVGFDIELAKLIAKKLGKTVSFKDMSFGSVLASLQTGLIDAAISTISITEERKKNFAFTDSYYQESMSLVYQKSAVIIGPDQIKNKKIACQMGTTMEFWLKKNATNTTIVLFNNNNQAIEALVAGHIDGVLLDSIQAKAFCTKNINLAQAFFIKSNTGYGIATVKGSKLLKEFNQVLQELVNSGELLELEKKWF